MKKLFPLFALILFLPILLSQKPPRNGDKPYAEGQIMVKLFSDLPYSQEQMLNKVMEDFQPEGLGMVQKLSDRIDIFLFSFNPSLVDDDRMLEKIKDHPFVELAQFNHFIQQRALYPNDADFALQWNMHNTGQNSGVPDADIDGPEAWDLGTSGVSATGDTIILAIVDDGFDLTHPDLSFWKNYHETPNNGIDDDNNGYIDDYNGWNSWTNSGTIVEKDHGTHVTGIAAAKGNNGIGVTGVNLNMKVLPVVGSATVESIVVAGYAYVLEMRASYNETDGAKGAFIVANNCSFGVNNGTQEDFPIWAAMYDSLGMVGILSAGATANANWDVDEVGDVPTSFPSEFLITVTNTDKNDEKSQYAGYGLTTIDLGAPGTQVWSTRMGNDYGYKTGTSMAAPHVTGAIGYMFSVADAAFMTAYQNDPAGMALVIKQYLLDGVDLLPTLQGKTVTGGRLNIYNSAKLMLDPYIAFDPLSVLKVMLPDEQDSVTLAFTNNSSSPLDYVFTYPAPLDWMSLSGPIYSTLPAYSTGNIKIHFNSNGYPADTLFTYLTFSFGIDGQKLIPVHLFVDPNVGVGEHGGMEAWGHGDLEVWPNPCREMLNVEGLMLNAGKDYSVVVYNSDGKQVQEFKIIDGQDNLKINTNAYMSGIYIVILKEGDRIIGSSRFIKLN